MGLEEARAVGAEADTLASDLVRVDDVLQDSLVDRRQSPATRYIVNSRTVSSSGLLSASLVEITGRTIHHTCGDAFASAGECCVIPCG
jgi:hypothetical protein